MKQSDARCFLRPAVLLLGAAGLATFLGAGVFETHGTNGQPVRVQTWSSGRVHHTATADHLFGAVSISGYSR